MKKLSLIAFLFYTYFNCASAQSFDAAYSNSNNNQITNALWVSHVGIQYTKNENYLRQLESGSKLVYVVYP